MAFRFGKKSQRKRCRFVNSDAKHPKRWRSIAILRWASNIFMRGVLGKFRKRNFANRSLECAGTPLGVAMSIDGHPKGAPKGVHERPNSWLMRHSVGSSDKAWCLTAQRLRVLPDGHRARRPESDFRIAAALTVQAQRRSAEIATRV